MFNKEELKIILALCENEEKFSKLTSLIIQPVKEKCKLLLAEGEKL